MGFDQIAGAVSAAGTAGYVARLVDFVGSIAAHDRITVTRYTSQARPQFVTHRNFSTALVERYLAVYYAFDPFNAYWRDWQRPGVIALRQFKGRDVKDGRYVGEFLGQSAIRDEVGILLADGPEATLGVFLERSSRSFGGAEIERLESAFPAIAAVHDAHRRLIPPVSPRRQAGQLWPQLTPREREIVAMILAGHPTRTIAARLGLSPGTVRNHRHSVYAKLDITTEREIFVQYVEHLPVA